jgi:hypothetical protein
MSSLKRVALDRDFALHLLGNFSSHLERFDILWKVNVRRNRDLLGPRERMAKVQSCGHYKDNSFVSMENFLHSGEVGMPRCQPGAVSVLGVVNGEVRMWEEISTLRSQPGPLRILGGISTFRAHPGVTSELGELSQFKVGFRVWLRFQSMESRLRSQSCQARLTDVSHRGSLGLNINN